MRLIPDPVARQKPQVRDHQGLLMTQTWRSALPFFWYNSRCLTEQYDLIACAIAIFMVTTGNRKPLSGGILRLNLYFYGSPDFRVQFDDSLVHPKGLDRFRHIDLLPVNVQSQFRQGLSDMNVSN